MQALTQQELQQRAVARIQRTHDYCAAQDVEKAKIVAKQAHALVDMVLAQATPGITESALRGVAERLFAQHGITQLWHPPYVRFGEHTLLTFQQRADDDRVLGEQDIAFIDLGIVVDGIEGDAGRTIAIGNHAEHQRVAAASRQIFDDAHAFWMQENPTGKALYDFIYARAAALHVAWNLDPAGHLIGAYPHQGWKLGINHFPETVESGKWILEIQVRHPSLPFGAFYEDLLYRE